MKNKRVIIVIVIALLLVGYYYLMIFSDKRVKLSVHEAGNFTKYTGELPKFVIQVSGMVSVDLDKKILDANGVIPYQFDAMIDDGWHVQTNKYIGYKMKDILGILKYQNIKSITAYNVGLLNVKFPLDFINHDSLFIVFYKDGQEIMNKKMALISIEDSSQYYIEDFLGISIEGWGSK